MINNKEEHESLVRSGMFWEFYPLLPGDWEKNKSYFEGNIKLDINSIPWEERMQEVILDNWNKEHNKYMFYEPTKEITFEDEQEMWKQIEKDYLVEQKENSIIKSTTLEKYINKLKQKELVYKECVSCDSNMIFLDQSIQVLREMEAELTSQFLKTKI